MQMSCKDSLLLPIRPVSWECAIEPYCCALQSWRFALSK